MACCGDVLRRAPVARAALRLFGVEAASVQGHQDLSQLLASIPGAQPYSNGVALPNGVFFYSYNEQSAQAIYDPAAQGTSIPPPAQRVLDYLAAHGRSVVSLQPMPTSQTGNYGLVQALLDLGGTYFNNNSIVMPDGTTFYNTVGDLPDTQSYFDIRQELIVYNKLPQDMPADPSQNQQQGPQQEVIEATLYVSGQGQGQQAVPCGGRINGVNEPFDVLVVVANKGTQPDDFQTTLYNGGQSVLATTDTIPGGGQKGYTVTIQKGQGSLDAQVAAKGGGSAECAIAIQSAPPSTQPPATQPPGTVPPGTAPPPDGGPSPGGPSQGYYGPAGVVPVPSLGIAIPVGGGQSYLVGSRTRQLLVSIGLLKVKG